MNLSTEDMHLAFGVAFRERVVQANGVSQERIRRPDRREEWRERPAPWNRRPFQQS